MSYGVSSFANGRVPPYDKRPVPLSCSLVSKQHMTSTLGARCVSRERPHAKWHEIELSEPRNIPARLLDKFSNFPSLIKAVFDRADTILNFPNQFGDYSIRKVRNLAQTRWQASHQESSINLAPQNRASEPAPVTRAAWRAGDWGSVAGRRRQAGWSPPRRRRSEA